MVKAIRMTETEKRNNWDVHRNEAHSILDNHVHTETWEIPPDIPTHGPSAGCTGGRLVCGPCGKTNSWKDWAPIYSYGAMTRMAKHLTEKHGLTLPSIDSPSVSAVYLGFHGRSWLDEKFKDV